MSKKFNKIIPAVIGIGKVTVFLISILFLQQLTFIPLTAISRKYWSQYDGHGLNEPWFFTSSISLLLVTVLVCFIFIKFIDNKRWSYLRLVFDKRLKIFFINISLSFIIILLFTTILSIFNAAELSINLRSPASIGLYLIILPIAGFALALREELIYRGYVLKTIEGISNKFIAIIVCSLLFSAFHLFRPNTSLLGFLNIFLMGSFLALICIYYNNLWAPTGLHFGWNFFLWFFNFPVSGQVYPNPILNLKFNEYSLLSGSRFGPEDSLMITPFLLILIVYYGLKLKRK